MITAFLVFVYIVIAVAIFYAGVYVGSWAVGKRLTDIFERVFEDSDLSDRQILDIMERLQEELKK